MAQILSNMSGNLGSRPAVRQGRSSYIGEGLVNLLNRIQTWTERSRTRGNLYQMPDYMLHDIGVSRSEVDVEWQKPFWQK